MSIQATAWALELPTKTLPSPTERHVLLVLANYANHDGTSVYPSISRIEKETGLNRRTIQRSLRNLEKHGLLKKSSKAIMVDTIPDTYKRPNAYTLIMDKNKP